MRDRLAASLRGPHLRLPRPLDAASEGWARLPPRLRALVALVAVAAVVLGLQARVRAVEERWGGPPRRVMVATRDLMVGDPADALRIARLPPRVVPRGALAAAPDGAVVSMPLPRGAVLTRAHLQPRGPAVGLPHGMRAVPIPVEAGWDVRAGGWVDVWTLGTGDAPARRVAAGRPVVQVRDDPGGLTSLVGLTAEEVEAVTAGLALGDVLLAHAPAPGADSMPRARP